MPQITTKSIKQEDIEDKTYIEYYNSIEDKEVEYDEETLVGISVEAATECDILVNFTGSFRSRDLRETQPHRDIILSLDVNGETKTGTVAQPIASIQTDPLAIRITKVNSSLHWGQKDLPEGNYNIEVNWFAPDASDDNEAVCFGASLQAILFYR